MRYDYEAMGKIRKRLEDQSRTCCICKQPGLYFAFVLLRERISTLQFFCDKHKPPDAIKV